MRIPWYYRWWSSLLILIGGSLIAVTFGRAWGQDWFMGASALTCYYVGFTVAKREERKNPRRVLHLRYEDLPDADQKEAL